MVADGMELGTRHPADVYRPGFDHLPGRREGPVKHADRGRAGAHRAGGGDARGGGAVGAVTSHPAWSAAVLGACAAACFLAAYAAGGWAW
jgi:hypothetical protein